MASSSATSRGLCSAIACAALLGAGMARAQQTTDKVKLAQTLFEEARTLFARGKTAEACDKFASSLELEARLGTLMNLAICHEKQGKIASAWSEFKEARAQANRENRTEREEFAAKRVAELAPRVSFVTIDVASAANVDKLVVTLDGVEVPQGGWWSRLPVDPGEHRVKATAQGRVAQERPFRVAQDGSSSVVAITPLEKVSTPAPTPASAPPAATTPAPAEEPAEDGSTRTIGFIVGGAGLLALGAGGYFGLSTLSKRSDAEKLCREGRCAEGQSLNDSAKTQAWIANAGIGLGAVALAVGGWLVLKGGPSKATAKVTPALDTRGAGASLDVVW